MKIITVVNKAKILHWGSYPVKVSTKAYQEIMENQTEEPWPGIIESLNNERELNVLQGVKKNEPICMFMITVPFPNYITWEAGTWWEKFCRKVYGRPPVILSLRRIGVRPLSVVAVRDDSESSVKLMTLFEAYDTPEWKQQGKGSKGKTIIGNTIYD